MLDRQFTAEEIEALEALRAKFTPEELAEIERRQRESAKLKARLAATETLEQQQQLADELCPRFDAWIRARNRIQSTPTRAPRFAAVIRPRPRGTGGRPRAQATRSSAKSGDSGEDSSDSDEPPGDGAGRRPAVAGASLDVDALTAEIGRLGRLYGLSNHATSRVLNAVVGALTREVHRAEDRERLRRLRDGGVCPRCGQTELASGGSRCGSCGADRGAS
jgi:hypothetical protein